MHCFTCGTKNPDNVGVCLHCGVTIGFQCPTCGTGNPPKAKFCLSCGQLVANQPDGTAQYSQKTGQSIWTERARVEEAERRLLTVLFCDLVGSTSLSERLDPEKLLRLLRAFQKVCREVVEYYGGHVAQYLGDGVLVYFGHPVSHEDDAQLAVRTALAIQNGVNNLNQSLRCESGLELSVRMGIHSGEVIVGRDQLAVGETPNVAARAQGLADANTVVMTAETHRLVKPFFTCRDLGLHRLKGLERQVRMYLVEGETGTQTRMQAIREIGMMPLGR